MSTVRLIHEEITCDHIKSLKGIQDEWKRAGYDFTIYEIHVKPVFNKPDEKELCVFGSYKTEG